jgi:hypothetical protein
MYPSTSSPDCSSGRSICKYPYPSLLGVSFLEHSKGKCLVRLIACSYLVVRYGTVVFMVMSSSLLVLGGGPQCGGVTCTSVGYCSIRHCSCLVSLMKLHLLNLLELIFVVRVCKRWLLIGEGKLLFQTKEGGFPVSRQIPPWTCWRG